MAESDDGALLAAFRAGHAAAFEAIVRRHYAALLRVADVRCGGGALAEDVVQVALVRAHRYLRGTTGVENLGAWLRRVVNNCANDLLREAHPLPAPSPDLAAGTDAAARAVESHELRALVEGAIARLPPVYREPLRLHLIEGLESKEIALQLNDNLNSVKSRLARGRRELRRRLEDVLTREGYL